MANPKFEASSGTPTFTFPDDVLPALPSDEFADDVDRERSDIRHTRHSTVIALYREDNFRRWRMEMISITKADAKLLRAFFDLPIFHYYPDSAVSVSYLVEWVETRFGAKLNGGGTYDLSFNIRET